MVVSALFLTVLFFLLSCAEPLTTGLSVTVDHGVVTIALDKL